jgi:hypothetical protein
MFLGRLELSARRADLAGHPPANSPAALEYSKVGSLVDLVDNPAASAGNLAALADSR